MPIAISLATGILVSLNGNFHVKVVFTCIERVSVSQSILNHSRLLWTRNLAITSSSSSCGKRLHFEGLQG